MTDEDAIVLCMFEVRLKDFPKANLLSVRTYYHVMVIRLTTKLVILTTRLAILTTTLNYRTTRLNIRSLHGPWVIG
jgi:hypothetical protein